MTSQELIDAVRVVWPISWPRLSYPQARPDLKPSHRHVFDSALSIPKRFSGVLRPDTLWCDCGAALYDAGERWELL